MRNCLSVLARIGFDTEIADRENRLVVCHACRTKKVFRALQPIHEREHQGDRAALALNFLDGFQARLDPFVITSSTMTTRAPSLRFPSMSLRVP